MVRGRGVNSAVQKQADKRVVALGLERIAGRGAGMC